MQEPAKVESTEDCDELTLLKNSIGEKFAFVLAALHENAAEQGRVAALLGLLADALADEINDAAADCRDGKPRSHSYADLLGGVAGWHWVDAGLYSGQLPAHPYEVIRIS